MLVTMLTVEMHEDMARIHVSVSSILRKLILILEIIEHKEINLQQHFVLIFYYFVEGGYEKAIESVTQYIDFLVVAPLVPFRP